MSNFQGAFANNREKHALTYFSCYECVSGRVRRPKYDMFHTNRIENVNLALAPEEYLMRRHRIIESYPLIKHPELPDADIAAAIHHYVSKTIEKEVSRDDAYYAFDGSALLAVAIEVEECIKSFVGEYGHLLYAERDKYAHNEDSSSDQSQYTSTDHSSDCSNDSDSEKALE